jgi:hypothetical protein
MNVKPVRLGSQVTLPMLGVLLMAFVLRVVGLSSRALWYDELQSVTHAYLPITQLLASVWQFDPHPPLYYLQLHFWMTLGVSDFWIKFNSVVWSMLALVSLFGVGRVLFDARVALMASALFAVSPLAIAYAQEARMYGWLMCSGVWSLWLTHQVLYGRGVLWAAGLIVSTLLFLYSHGTGFMLLVSLASYVGMCQAGRSAARWNRVSLWGGALLMILIVYSPWLVRAQSISVGHTLVPNVNDVVTTFLVLLFGFGDAYPLVLRWFGLKLAVLAVVLALVDEKGRRLAVAFGLAPIVVCLLVSYFFKPIWLYRTFAYLTPWLCLTVSAGMFTLLGRGRVAQMRVRLGAGLYAAVIALFLSAGVVQQHLYTNPWHIREATRYVRQAAQVGEIVYLPNERVFWGWAWYFVGPGSVNPLTTTYRLTSVAGVEIVSRLTPEQLVPNRHYWLVYRQIDSAAPFEARSPGIIKDFDRMTVEYVYYPGDPFK